MTFKQENAEGLALMNAGKLEEAEAIFRSVLHKDPGDAEALQLMGQMAQAAGNWDAAEKLYLRSLETDPDQFEVWTNFGALLNDLRRGDAAKAALQNALNLNPDYAPAYQWQGAIEIVRGNLAGGLALLERAQKLNPRLVAVYARITMNKKISPDDPLVATMTGLLSDPVMLPEDLSQLHFGLAYVYEKAGMVQEFFAHLKQANTYTRTLTGDWRPDYEASLNYMKMCITPEFFAKAVAVDKKRFTPIFIVSLPRSGSTLVEQILASHGDVFGGDELPYFLKFMTKVVGAKTGKAMPEGLEQLDRSDFAKVADLYQDRVGALAPGAKYITDKLPWNFQLLGLIRTVFPWTKVIHIERNALDCGFSIYKSSLSSNYPHCCDFDDYAYYRRQYLDLMTYWRKKLPGFICDVKYEELVANPEAEIRRITDFCGLPWQPAMLEFHKTRREVRTLSQEQVLKPINKDGIGSAEKYAPFLQPLKDALKKYNIPAKGV